MRRLFLILIASCVVGMSTCQAIASPLDDAVAAAQRSIIRMHDGDFAAAIGESWDADASLTAAFGLKYLNLSPEQRERAQRAFIGVLAAPFANEKLASLNKTMNPTTAKVQVLSETSVIVRMNLVADEGKFKSSTTLLMNKIGDRWRVVDQQLSSSSPFRAEITNMYNENKAAADSDSIPAVFEKISEDIRKAAQARK